MKFVIDVCPLDDGVEVAFITSNNTADEDNVTLVDGVVGQRKLFIYETDTEDSGVAITPANFANGTDVLLEDANDAVEFIFM